MSPLAPGRGGLRLLRQRIRLESQLRRDLSPPAPAAFGAFGSRSWIVPPARVTNPELIELGDDSFFLEGAWLSVVRAHEAVVPRLIIGDRVHIGRGASIACIGEVVFEDDVGGSDDIFVADCYHDYTDPFTPILYQPMSAPEPVRICAGAYLGAGSVVLQGVTVGRGAYVGEGALVTTDVPPGVMVQGNPARITGQVSW